MYIAENTLGRGTSIACGLIAAVTALACAPTPASAQWKQWGGPQQDFKVECDGLADEWPDEGPKKLWSQKLGQGYSAIVVDGDRLFTMYREEDQEVVLCLDAKTGKKIWDFKYAAPIKEGHAAEFGTGPRATPLVFDKRVYTIGVSGHMHCLARKTGKKIWAHNLWEEYDGTVLNHGYSSSPFGYKNLVIVMVGGKGHSLVAFDKKTGKLAWKRHDFINSYSTPKLINVDGEDQLLCFMATELVAIDPVKGALKWSFPHQNQWKQNVTLPIWDDKEHLLFITSSPQAGSKGLKLTKSGKKTEVSEVWANKRVGVHHSNAIQVGDTIYTSAAQRGPGLFYAVDLKTGEVKWKERGFAKANCIYADGKLIILDEDGNLGLVDPSPEKFKIIAQVPLLSKVSWTVPTLVGTTLYVRDQNEIVALDLGDSGSES
jgi:outer membrane protein assembly factor BamB